MPRPLDPPDRSFPTRADALLLEGFLLPALPPPRREPGAPFDIDAVVKRVAQSVPALAADLGKSPATLLAELLALSVRERERALATRPSLRRREFLGYLREAALAALPLQPDCAESLACLAVQQAEESLPVDEARRHLLTAYCLIATVRRLRRLPGEAERLLDRAAFLSGSPAEDALYLRSLAVLRWEQGRANEAQAFLSRILQVFRRPTLKTGRAQLLLGLLHLLEGAALARPTAVLRSACASLDAAHSPLPALLARLGLALASGQAGDLAAATEQRLRARELFGPLAEDPSALAYPTWLDARVAALTEPGKAVEALQAARQILLDHRLPWAATLATVDAALILAATGSSRQVAELLAEAPLPLALPPVRSLCETLADPPRGSLGRAEARAALRREAARLPALLRRVAILRGVAIEPLPFV